MTRDYIFISISQLQYSDLDRFFNSLEEVECNATVVCFYGDTDEETLAVLRRRGVVLEKMHEHLFSLPFYSRKLNALKWLYPLMLVVRSILIASGRLMGAKSENRKEVFAKHFHKICSMRFFYYRDYLRRNIHHIDRVLLTDVRDVIFQDNPFSSDWDLNSLYVFLEKESVSIENDRWNKYWIRKLGGTLLLQKIGKNPISCAGVTYGGVVSVMEYLEKMCQNLREHISQFDLDQGIHNMLIWTGQLTKIEIGKCMNSSVLTVGLFKESECLWNNENKLINKDGSVISIVHQYDRLPSISKRLTENN